MLYRKKTTICNCIFLKIKDLIIKIIIAGFCQVKKGLENL